MTQKRDKAQILMTPLSKTPKLTSKWEHCSGTFSSCRCITAVFSSHQLLAAAFLNLTVLGTSNGKGNGKPLQYSCLENPMDGGAWWATVNGVATSWSRLKDFTFTFHFHAMEKEMATHSSVLAWRIPGTGEPGGLLFMGSHRVGLN